MALFSESIVEEAALDWLRELGYQVIGSDAPPGEGSLRKSYAEVILPGVLRGAIRRLNPQLSEESVEEVFRKISQPEGKTMEMRNRVFHRLLIDGVDLEYRRGDGSLAVARSRVIDSENPGQNDWMVVNQLTVQESEKRHRFDLVLFINGLPLVLIEIKNPESGAGIDSAFLQIESYKAETPTFFNFNEMLVISDGRQARIGSLTDGRERFRPWRTISGESPAPVFFPEIQVVIEGLFERRRFLDLIRYFVAFVDTGDFGLAKRMATYYQFQAVNLAVSETLRASGMGVSLSPEHPGGAELESEVGDRRVGIVGQALGTGRSSTLVFYAGRILQEPAMAHPTILVVTDRHVIDRQLFHIFWQFRELLRLLPVRAESRADLRALLSRNAGGVILTTIHKFLPAQVVDIQPVLSNRRNLVVVADEVHRGHLGRIARHMHEALPNASFIGFTGMPVELLGRSTRFIFGDYISVYDFKTAIGDGAAVPVYFERRADLAVDHEHPGFLARDVVEHFERRLEAMSGKAIVVCRSRRSCVELYEQIVALCPDWHHRDDGMGSIKVVMTGSGADPAEWQPHVRDQSSRGRLAMRFIDPEDSLQLVLVCNLWLTGLDAPALHTMYLTRPMNESELLQAVTQLSRSFRDKPGGLIVDYQEQTRGLEDPRGALLDRRDAVTDMLEVYEVCCELFRGFDRSKWMTGEEEERRMLLPDAQEHILAQKNGERRLMQAVEKLSRAFALAMPSSESLLIQDEVAFFQTVRLCLVKLSPEETWREGAPSVLRPIAARRFASEEHLDIFTAAGLSIPISSVLSEDLLLEVERMPQSHLAVRVLSKVLSIEILACSRKNLAEARTLSNKIEDKTRRYRERSAKVTDLLDELIALAGQIRESRARGESLGLRDEEMAFYDALAFDDPAVQRLGTETLRNIARSLFSSMRQGVTIDWQVMESSRARLRTLIRRILRKSGYPPDRQERATQAVLEQAEIFSEKWMGDS